MSLIKLLRNAFRRRGATRVPFQRKKDVILPRTVAWDRASRVYGDTQ